MTTESEALLRVRRWREALAKELEGKTWQEVLAYLKEHRGERVLEPDNPPTLADLRGPASQAS